jgi:hypothetical protein
MNWMIKIVRLAFNYAAVGQENAIGRESLAYGESEISHNQILRHMNELYVILASRPAVLCLRSENIIQPH